MSAGAWMAGDPGCPLPRKGCGSSLLLRSFEKQFSVNPRQHQEATLERKGQTSLGQKPSRDAMLLALPSPPTA